MRLNPVAHDGQKRFLFWRWFPPGAVLELERDQPQGLLQLELGRQRQSELRRAVAVRLGTARYRFQPTSQHAADLTTSGIKLLVGQVGNTFTIFAKIQHKSKAIEPY